MAIDDDTVSDKVFENMEMMRVTKSLIPIMVMLLGEVLLRWNGLQAQGIVYDTVSSGAAYTIRGNLPMDDLGTTHHFVWVRSTDGGQTWRRIPNSNSQNLVVTGLQDGMAEMTVRSFLYKRYLWSTDRVSESGVVGLIVGYGYRVSQTIDTVTPCMESSGFTVTTPLPATFEWRCLENGRILSAYSTSERSSTYKVRMNDLKTQSGDFPTGLYNIVLKVRLAGGHTENILLQTVVRNATTNPFNYKTKYQMYGTDSWTVASVWGGVDAHRWSLEENQAPGVVLNDANSYMTGLNSVGWPNVEPNYRPVAKIQAVCTDYPDRKYMAELALESDFSVSNNVWTTVDYNYTGAVQALSLSAGKYRFECWGSQSNNGAYGGYSTGILNLGADRTFYAYVGANNGWNGGASGYSNFVGGGASDIRLTGGAWNNATGLRNRIIVAGGGGAIGNGGSGGYGGGVNGANGSGSVAYGMGGVAVCIGL